jgi:hypothetical protein
MAWTNRQFDGQVLHSAASKRPYIMRLFACAKLKPVLANYLGTYCMLLLQLCLDSRT